MSNNTFGYKKATSQEMRMIARILHGIREFSTETGNLIYKNEIYN